MNAQSTVWMNGQSAIPNGVKEKIVTYFNGRDTLIGFLEYDKKQRLTKRFDRTVGDSVSFRYNNSNEWVTMYSIDNDTVATKTILFDQKNKPKKVIIEGDGLLLSYYEIKELNDTLFQVYQKGRLHSTIIQDTLERVRRFEWSDYQAVFKYNSDTLITTTLYYMGESTYFSTAHFEDGKLMVIDKRFGVDGRYQHKNEYNADNKIIRSHFGIFFNGSFTYYPETEYHYDVSGKLIKETHYRLNESPHGQRGTVMKVINYTYY